MGRAPKHPRWCCSQVTRPALWGKQGAEEGQGRSRGASALRAGWAAALLAWSDLAGVCKLAGAGDRGTGQSGS